MNVRKIIVTMVVIFSLPAFANQKGSLKISADGFSDDKGQAVALVFKKGDKMPTSHSFSVTGIIRNKKADLQIDNLEFGEYAIIVYHDSNNNNEVDHTCDFQLNNWVFPEVLPLV